MTNVFDTQVAAGFAGFAAQAGYTGLLHDVLKIRVAKTASFTRWDARPLTAEQLSYAREDVEHLLPLADEIQKRLRSQRAGSSGRARSAARSPTRATSATREEVWRRLPRVRRAGPARARRRARAGGLARAHRGARGPPGRLDPARPDAGRARQAPARGPPRAGPDPRRSTRTSCAAAAPTCSRRSSAAATRRRSGSRSPSGCRPSPWTDRRSALAEALVRARAQEAGLAYELIAARADLTPIVVAARRGDPEPECARSRAGAASSSALSCSSCCAGAAGSVRRSAAA